jgi:predicted ATP-dependent endonuclease of OLD family
MKIKNIKITKFRSIENAEIFNCGNLNIFIGKNNSGKSNILAAIELVKNHLSKSVIASKWTVNRSVDEFYNRESEKGLKIAIEFEISSEINIKLRENLQINFPNLERAISELASHKSITFIISGEIYKEKSYLYIEQIFAGELRKDTEIIDIVGTSLLNVSSEVALELFLTQEDLSLYRADLTSLNHASTRAKDLQYFFQPQNRDSYRNNAAGYITNFIGNTSPSPEARKNIISLFASVETHDEFQKGIESLIIDLTSKLEQAQKKETSRPFNTFAGETRIQPEYVSLLTSIYGSIPLLHLKESKNPIGREEAEDLLKLKITRGGPERLKVVQNTVRSLLGVEVDAFQPDDRVGKGIPSAEMDVDQFLAEANGAGVRESLRLILDLELKSPKLVLLEEPEVHLHPGLEYSIHSYLKEKSINLQIFTTTHSTNFVDSVSFQNIYLVSKENVNGTKISIVDEKNGALKIPTALGLKLSTVFMYDRLLFVEGPSDEAVLRKFADIMNIDLAKSNMNFVQMGGVMNFAHYAAEHTLSLLSRKNLKLWFLIDRDEKTDSEVEAMIDKLGENAKLIAPGFRDLENCLLDPNSVLEFIKYKQKSLTDYKTPTIEEVEKQLNESAIELKDRLIEKKINNRLLRPVYLQNRKAKGNVVERIESAITELQQRLETLESLTQKTKEEIDTNWENKANKLVPGAEILDSCCQKFGIRFQKDEGDSAKLADYIKEEKIPAEIKNLLEEISKP